MLESREFAFVQGLNPAYEEMKRAWFKRELPHARLMMAVFIQVVRNMKAEVPRELYMPSTSQRPLLELSRDAARIRTRTERDLAWLATEAPGILGTLEALGFDVHPWMAERAMEWGFSKLRKITKAEVRICRLIQRRAKESGRSAAGEVNDVPSGG